MITIIFASLLNGSAKVGNTREDHVPYQVLLPQLCCTAHAMQNIQASKNDYACFGWPTDTIDMSSNNRA